MQDVDLVFDFVSTSLLQASLGANLKYKITLKNETNLDTIEFKRFAKRCLEEFNKFYFVKHSSARFLTLYVFKSKRIFANQRVLGRAPYNSRIVKLYIPLDQKDFTPENCQYWANVIWHELEHCEGKRHKEMRGGCHISDTYPTEWAKEYTIKYKEPKQIIKTPEVKVNRKIISLEYRRKNWESKLKRAQNSLKTINRQLTYYNNRMAAMKENK